MEIYGERENDRESIRSYLKNILDPFFYYLKILPILQWVFNTV